LCLYVILLGNKSINLADAERKLDAVLKKYQLANYVDAAHIEEWLHHDKNRFDAIPASLLVGLLSDSVSLTKAGPEIVNALLGIAQSMPLAQLKGRSPQEAYRDREARGKRPDIRLNVTPLGGSEWNEAYREAITFLQNYEFGKALRGIQKAFKIMLAAKTTIYDVFRLYGNLALCYFAAGEKVRGKRTLDIALELNPNYDFALELKGNYENGNYDSGLVSGVRRALSGASHFFRGVDYATRYYDFIKPFGITFATKHLTHTPHIVIGPESNRSRHIGRNDPCYCGSGKKFKRCHRA